MGLNLLALGTLGAHRDRVGRICARRDWERSASTRRGDPPQAGL